MRRTIAVLVALGLMLALGASQALAAGNGASTSPKFTNVQLLAINDLHGHLQPTTPGSIQVGCCNAVLDANKVQTAWAPKTVPAGGIAYLATWIKTLRTQNSNTLTVGAGDMIGASPLVSALFHDEPTIESLNSLGMDVSGVGNHEFDEGVTELLRMQNGGCGPVDSCKAHPFEGADFQYLAANVFYMGTNNTILPPYEIKTVDGKKIAFIGLTLEGTPTIVTPSAVAGLEFKPEVATVNALVQTLASQQKVKAFVVLLHQGGSQTIPAPVFPGPENQPDAYMDVNKCVNFNGPEITSIANGLDDRIKVVVSAHTHQPYVCTIDGKLVTSAASFGRVVTSIDLELNPAGVVTQASAVNHVVTQDVTPDPATSAILKTYEDLSAPLANRIVGTISGDILSARGTPNGQNAAGEQPMGDVIADAMLERTTPSDFGGAVAAFMNSGGVRASLFLAKSGVETVDGQVTYAEAFAVQPFGNTLVVKTCTGQQLYDVLNQQFNNPAVGSNRIMLPSANVDYHWTTVGGPHVVDGTLSFDDGATFVNKAASYRVVMNNFMADGGDGYTVFRSCTDPLGGDVDLDAFTAYLDKHKPVAAPLLDRIHKDA
ncbi:MAG TPA: bifunctional metallophosphatase/5'-nucleotidase [Gaiella sp.]|nr:bifunctional metallophosphatase/5'-nucleotidase [Gaiella sp.]